VARAAAACRIGIALLAACGPPAGTPDGGDAGCTPAGACTRQRECTTSDTDFKKVCECGGCVTTGDADTLTTLKVNVIPLRPSTPRSHLTRAYYGLDAAGAQVTCEDVVADPKRAGLNELFFAQASNIPQAFDLITMPIAQPKGSAHVVYVEFYDQAAGGGLQIGHACKTGIDVTGDSHADTYTLNAEK
jgi:hypothetical protein